MAPIPSLLAGGGSRGLQSCSAPRTFRPVQCWFCSSPVCGPALGVGMGASLSWRPGRRERSGNGVRPAPTAQAAGLYNLLYGRLLPSQKEPAGAAADPPSSSQLVL